MKMIYQQLLSFFLVIAVTILLLGFSFSRMSKTFVYDNTWRNLEKYSDSLVQQSLTINSKGQNKISFDVPTLKTTEALLENQSVHFTVFNPKNQVIYPNNGMSPKITKNDWKHLRKDQIVRKVNNKNFRLTNGKTRPAMIEVLKPYYYKKKLVAAVSAGAFISDVNSNVDRINRDLLKGLGVSLIISMVISFFIASRLNRRISRLRNAANQVANGNYQIRVKTSGKDEIGELINDFNHMTESLDKADKEIQRQEERRQEFLADAAHEMRTPLTTISGILEGIKYDVIPQESRTKSIDLMSSETQRLIRLVNENLDYEKIRSNSIQLDKRHFNATQVLNNLVEQLENKAAESKDKIDLHAPKDLPIYADYDRFVQIVFNITNNAIQFTDKGTITITGERGYNETIVRVADTGIGMTDAQQKNIFERYYKADASRRSGKYGESGLGLAIVHQLVKQHGGNITVESAPGKGTTFTVIIPDQTKAEKQKDEQSADADQN
ncbi:MAG: HAMP domain-containing histidine kinase [Lentilactobacillus diolivorans]|jgi:signal transduction histidine kinase|uniref:histidine kinase n=2 Tax=Lentilactobacillus diolivorans TaxID=179838 RepID=A0A0R1SUU1_9LACO|nr:HAMP domain-containing sensor histidine kinase [Lentilactobacillus diolivorans]RRG04441.1 MAG: sensor histidine kinase [Lactobacillus sp.]KRL69051.1 integral membrane sensor signal transduction histidine kinase [Lentilactobacillus diolivorans DSM 14421]MCH4164207.1 HAMP domain-containing histidine kinase [Lentilactobacillus diolivorans]MDH5104637.1 HAMP domain-containing histidine kinase [Lentilactobacillus diolivorans]GEP22502.1 signal transduction histidine kinase [Lentilactobacillus diol